MTGISEIAVAIILLGPPVIFGVPNYEDIRRVYPSETYDEGSGKYCLAYFGYFALDDHELILIN